MAGGLFGRPFVLNIKCIVFSLLVMTLFLYKPNIKNNYVMAATLTTIFWHGNDNDMTIFMIFNILPLKRGEKSVMDC